MGSHPRRFCTGEIGEAAERPGQARMSLVVEYRFGRGRSAPRGRFSDEPSRRGVLTRSRLQPPTGGREATLPDRAGDFSPRLARSPGVAKGYSRRSGPGLDAGFPEKDRSAPPDPAGPSTTADGRCPLDRPHHPSGRQLDGLPSGGARDSMRPVSGVMRRFCSVTLNAAVRALNLQALRGRDAHASAGTAPWPARVIAPRAVRVRMTRPPCDGDVSTRPTPAAPSASAIQLGFAAGRPAAPARRSATAPRPTDCG
jgi:hypothetical protein